MKKFPVLEIFGPTVQGEGMVVGQKTMFVRTAGCDYSCSWCDSAFTWDGSGKDDIEQMTSEQIWEELRKIGGNSFGHVTISGGNPALLTHLNELIDLLHEKGVKVAIETQGSRWQEWFVDIDDLTISPKPPSSTMNTNFGMLDEILEKLQVADRFKNVSLKVVVFDDKDLEYATEVHQRYPHIPFFVQVGNEDLQEADSTKLMQQLIKKYEWLIDQTMASEKLVNVRVLPQLHTFVWGNKRGV
ncbi:7-carboxy-7-deazaguanine synthase QueE [Peribacillus alkalitolerans]|uniref:7-carboxy-7-deazaguanine synthase QueE n=1 Tax=Peribacillus alkalitolerans TaxID=1550385 RepID=UPI0013D72679|nr:7-carboxy-7-deazaguanine synthase QueE [Peribacillus alkalitolerans]